MAESVKVIIDCDPGFDDAVALLYAAQHLHLVGVTTVHGNNTLANTTRNALSVLSLGGIDAPVAIGAAEPLVQPPFGAAAVHGKTGLDGAALPTATASPIDAHAMDFIIETASMHRGELVLASIGPQTNIALALRREPRLGQWLREITIMGGSVVGGNITAAAEFNVFCDPEAASMVFRSGIPIRMVGCDVTSRTGLDAGDITRLRESGRTVAGTVADLMSFYLAEQGKHFGLSTAPMHDVCALVPYVDGSLISYVKTSVEVELAGTATRGMTVCDMRNLSDREAVVPNARAPNAFVATAAESRPLIEHVIDTLLLYH